MTFEFECIKILNFMNFQHENTDKIIQNHDFERKFFGVAHFFVILTVYPKMSKHGVYKKRSNPNLRGDVHGERRMLEEETEACSPLLRRVLQR